MAFYFHERPNSRASTTTPPTLTLNYVAGDETNAATVRAYAIAATAAIQATTQGILYRQDLIIDPQGPSIWHITVPYGVNRRAVGQRRLQFDTTGGTINIKASKSTVASYAASGTPTNHKQLIGVHGDNVDGADIVIPALKLTLTRRWDAGYITLAQIKNLARYTGKVNSDTFLTFAPGEVLFLGCIGQEGDDVETEVTYQFACSENLQNEIIGGITVLAKDGWDVAWIEYSPKVDGGKPALQPLYIYVERVYNRIPLGVSLGL